MTEADWLACIDPDEMLNFLRGTRTVRPEPFFGSWVPVEKHRDERIGLRRLRLFACACCRRIEYLFTPERVAHAIEVMDVSADGYRLRIPLFGPDCCLHAVEMSEGFADGQGDPAMLESLREAAHAVNVLANSTPPSLRGSEAICWELQATGNAADAVENACEIDYYWLMRVAGKAAHALVCDRSQTGKIDLQQHTEERIAQCVLLRDIVGDPFRPCSGLASSILRWNDCTIPRIANGIYTDRAFERMPILHDALLDAGCADEALLTHCRNPEGHVRGCWALDLILGKE
jgi:hypothetical protein